MKTMLMMFVLAVPAFAETDAERAGRLEKEVATLKVEVARLKVALEALRPGPKVVAPAKLGKAIDPNAIISMVPKVLHGTSNVAAGKPFDPVKWNGWLWENVQGKSIECSAMTFGYLKEIEEGVDKGSYSISIGTREWGAVCILDSSYQTLLAKLKEHTDQVVITGTIRSIEIATDRLGDPLPKVVENPIHRLVIENCKVKVIQKEKAK